MSCWAWMGCCAAPAHRTGRRSARWGITVVCVTSLLWPWFEPSRIWVRYVVGIDVGGTNLVAGVVAEDGSEIHGVVSEPTLAAQGADPVIGRIIKLAKASIKESGKKVEGVGIGSPGPLNTKTGVVLLTPNLGWTNMPLRDRVSEGLGLPATLDNDANCAIYGEWWRGAARGATPPFPVDRAIRVVVERRREAEAFAHPVPQRHVRPAEVWREQHDTRLRIERARRPDPDAFNLLSRLFHR